MVIKDSKTIKDIQKEFQDLYPALKIAFYKEKHGDHQGSKKSMEYTEDLPLAEIRTKHTEGEIKIDPEMSVQHLEESFENTFGLHVQIFRRSGDLWLQTITTDDWSLNKQNERGLRR